MQFFYLIALLIIIGCLVLVDKRFSLAFFYNKKQTAMTLVVALVLFIAWDIFGIRTGVFFHGDSKYTLPLRIIPEFPIEELFFLFVLSYSALLIYRFASTKAKGTVS